MGRNRSENSDRFMAKYGTHDLHKDFDHSNPEPNKYLLKYSSQMNREHALKALHHPNEAFAGHAAVATAYLKRSDLENYMKTGPSHYVKGAIKHRFDLESMPEDKMTWLDKHMRDSYKYLPEDQQ